LSGSTNDRSQPSVPWYRSGTPGTLSRSAVWLRLKRAPAGAMRATTSCTAARNACPASLSISASTTAAAHDS